MKDTTISWAISIMVVLLLGCSWAGADSILMTNGDRLQGRILVMQNGQMTFQSDMIGKVTIPMKNIQTFQTDDLLELHLTDGTVIKAAVRPDQPGKITIEDTPTIKAQRFALSDLNAVNPPPVIPVTRHGSFTIGLTSSHGNTFDESGNISFDITREKLKTPYQDKSRWNTKAIYVFGRTEEDVDTDGNGIPDDRKKVTTEENITLTGKYDRYFNGKKYGFLSGSWKKDHIADLDRRLIAGIGAGYEWKNNDRVLLTTDLGAAFLHEKYVTPAETDSRDELSAQLGYTCNVKLNGRLSLLHSSTYYPSFESYSDYFLSSTLELRARIDDAWHAGFKTILDYDATPGQGSSSTDTKYILGVGASF